MHPRQSLGLTLIATTLLATPQTATAALIARFVDPVVTDPLIRTLDEFPDADNRNLHHLVTLDEAAAVGNRLFVWLPGTGGLPDDYEAYAETPARAGFHTVSIAYPNLPAVHELLNAVPLDETSSEVRGERLFGDDRSPLIDVDRPNSIENRLIKLLKYNRVNFPNEGWDAYLNADDSVRWDRVVVGGHSQGAGHAAFLSKQVRLAGVNMFGGPGDNIPGQGTASWLSGPSATPEQFLYAFNHQLDVVAPGVFSRLQTLGLTPFGALQNVDGLSPDELSSHNLTSSHVEPGVTRYHSATIADDLLFFDDAGLPFYQSTWEYMLDSLIPRGDFNEDGAFDIDDIDALVTEIVLGTGDLSLDVNGDDQVNVQDLGAWLTHASDANLPYGSMYRFGDANLDGIVDGQDFLVWNDAKFSFSPTWSSGDFNADGRVDGRDFIIWNNNKFQADFASWGESLVAVPEPILGWPALLLWICGFNHLRPRR